MKAPDRELVRFASLKKQFEKRTGYRLNLKNPKTYCEKVQWRKVYDRRAMLPRYADKIAARSIVADIFGSEYLVPSLYTRYGEPTIEEIEATMLRECIIKANHGCGWMIFQGLGGEYLDAKQVLSYTRDWLDSRYGGDKLQWAEGQIEPGVLVEAAMSYRGDRCPLIKVYCFDGDAKLGHCLKHGAHAIDGKGRTEAITWYDPQGELLDLSFDLAPATREAAPTEFRRCIELSETLARGIDHVRVDWLITDDGPKFSEFTWCSWSGMFRFSPPEQDRIMGGWWTLPKELV